MKIDFTNSPINYLKTYGGANGGKINISYENNSYMLKFPPVSKTNLEISYVNSCISEYISCQIVKSIGISVQETLLGTYTTNSNKEKVVVACLDFTADNKTFFDFAS